ncbi:hypothetical protein JCM3775_006004 [Rhodotorula graminis]|uniref:Arrestin-like N-terminal domain-containing protein n=1 Tax=Rhodotorula graminis (strain WP1) TaxID=578459 RepID=A0A194SA50_RHOGW|nr:uncharacterized protein RHOBADRAFT_51214 [Rhodotorula graminis WP1]KPV77340.1 hypothetical protein RHOBADRAFT_51214 [Rhodotorula graminis WP1]
MLSRFASPTVSVTLSQDIVFVHALESPFPSQDPVVHGTTLIKLPSRKAIRRVKVVLEGLCDACGGGALPYETTSVLSKSLEHDLAGEVFEAGNHAFNFTFIIPSSTPASQRSCYGRTRYYVKALVEFDGMLNGGVVSPPVALWISANPSPPGEIPFPLDLSFQHFSPDLGPVGVGISSPHLTVAALCNVRLSLLGPPKPVSIVSVVGVITQTFTVHYRDGTVARPKPMNLTLKKVDHTASPSLSVPIHNPATCSVAPGPVIDLPRQVEQPIVNLPSFRPVSTCCTIHPDVDVPDPTPLARVEAGQEFHHSRICRVPDDDHVRPSTLDGSPKTVIRVSHQLSVEVRYRKDGDTEDMILTMGKPVTITSCCCLVDSLTLPAYCAKKPSKTIIRPLESRCACNMTLKECLDRDGVLLQRAGVLDPPSSEARFLGVGSDDKSPAYTAAGHDYLSSVPIQRRGTFDSGFEDGGG